ncbi:MAG TPA: ribosome small subunit-dependent GTPase A [Gemmatimonadales bacterium]|nr:ribosome small subunit-dependent GTPase A [Gemmatimonadales bacterium]
MVSGIVLAREGSQFRVRTGQGDVTATLRGRTKRHDGRALPGDHVQLESSGSEWAIASVDPRRNVLARREPGGRRERPLAANLDRVFVMTATRDPDPVPQLIDRLLVLAEVDDIPAAVIVNKLDKDPGTALIERMTRVGYEVFPVCVKAGIGLDALFHRMHGRISVVTGPSGAGKSSLLNALQPGLGLRTAEVSERIGRGKNTTVTAQMIPLEQGGFLADTPGLSEIRFWGLDPQQLVRSFPDLVKYVDDCRFPDCRHKTEPGCAVRAAVGGEIAEDRYESYLIFLEEIETLPKDWE